MMYKSDLFTFAYVPYYNKAIEYLAENLADSEDWDFSDVTIKNYSILKNYIEHIFRKIQSEKKILYTNDNSYACFNTGLVTKNLEQIYAYFQAYNNSKKELHVDHQPFCFKAFLKESDAQFLKIFPNNHPDIANFFEKPEDLIFNPRCKIIPQLDHILDDNLERFPQSIQDLDENARRRRLEGAIEEVRKRVKTNYKLAVPQYYKDHIQLLLPLNLTAGSPNPDLALAIYKISKDTYTARTCLTLKMAYNNARLIVKPQSVWLKP